MRSITFTPIIRETLAAEMRRDPSVFLMGEDIGIYGGTLDDEALSTALATLVGLRQDGKLIGVISHVQAIKDQITAQIRIHPQSGGRSTLSGPGINQNRSDGT